MAANAAFTTSARSLRRTALANGRPMIFSRLRLVGLAAFVIGALLTADIAIGLRPRPGIHLTVVGAILNLAPGGFFLLGGGALLAAPRRLILAFWLAPLCAPVLALMWALSGLAPVTGIFVIASAILAHLGMLTVGAPTFAYLRRRAWNGIAAYASAGATTGAASVYIAALVALTIEAPDGASAQLFAAAFAPMPMLAGLVFGLGCGAAYWAIARPDRSPPNPLKVFS
jgi:hypothetical protein